MNDPRKGLADLLLAGIGAAQTGLEQAASVTDRLIRKGEAALRPGGVANEPLRHNAEPVPAAQQKSAPAAQEENWLGALSDRQLELLAQAVAEEQARRRGE